MSSSNPTRSHWLQQALNGRLKSWLVCEVESGYFPNVTEYLFLAVSYGREIGKLLRNFSLSKELGFPLPFFPLLFLSETRVVQFHLFIVLIVSNFQREAKKIREGGKSILDLQ